MCFDFQRGRCTRGDSCRFSHDADGRGSPPRAVGKRPLDTEAGKVCSLFVGNLPYDANEDSLRDVFGKYGEITNLTLPINRETGRSRGFGFVTFSDPMDAKEAHEKLTGHTINGRALRLDYDAGKDKKQEAGYLGDGGTWHPTFNRFCQPCAPIVQTPPAPLVLICSLPLPRRR